MPETPGRSAAIDASPSWPVQVRAFCEAAGLVAPDGLDEAERAAAGTPVAEMLYRVDGSADAPPHLEWALLAMQQGSREAPPFLLPVLPVDDGSFACVVCGVPGRESRIRGAVVRWHLDDVPPKHQAALLDVSLDLYVESAVADLAARDDGLRRMLDEIGPAYATNHIKRNKRPRDYAVRPVRIACQNVVIGLAAIAQESSFDGLSVIAWQTCEAPHVATHEANRALAALTLCDAFQNGGTMEIRFDQEARVAMDGRTKVYEGHPEGRVPASLRRFGRTVGVLLGQQDEAAITPAEARELFLAVTPMPPELRAGVNHAIERRGIAPERLCFTLLSQVWREIELDFLLAMEQRSRSILDGGAPWSDRSARQSEMETCRAALMMGMLFRRLNGRDAAAGDSEARVVEDRTAGVRWRIHEGLGAVEFDGLDESAAIPWLGPDSPPAEGPLLVFPRSIVTEDVLAQADELASNATVALVVPADFELPQPVRGLVMRCPERLADLDKAVEAKLLTSRISRG